MIPPTRFASRWPSWSATSGPGGPTTRAMCSSGARSRACWPARSSRSTTAAGPTRADSRETDSTAHRASIVAVSRRWQAGAKAAGAASAPAADLHVLGVGRGLAAFEPVLESEQEVAPLGAAVGHEVDRLAPASVREPQHCLFARLRQVKGQLGADPFVRAAHAAPAHVLIRAEGGDLHDGAGLGTPEVEPELAAYTRIAIGGAGPPSGQAVHGSERLVDAVGRCGDPYVVIDVWHVGDLPSDRRRAGRRAASRPRCRSVLTPMAQQTGR